ncbi:MAG: PHP domain-containing protein [Rikenellaceae bacterium]
MKELTKWLDANKIEYKVVDHEVVEITGVGMFYLADLSGVKSIFKDDKFNLMESADVLIEEGIHYVAFPFGDNWYYYDLRGEFQFNLLKYVGVRKSTELDIPFVNLGVHTPYELLNGSGDISTWVRKAKYLGHTALGICDHNTMAGTLTLQKECKKQGINHIFGYSLTLQHIDESVDVKLYALSQQGLQNLLRVQKAVMVDSTTQTISLNQLLEHNEGLALVIGKLGGDWLSRNRYLIPTLKQSFDRLYFQVDLTEYKADRIDSEVLLSVAIYFRNFANPLTYKFEIDPILICDTYYLDREDARNKIVLNKIATGAAHRQSEEQYFKDIDEHYAVLKPLFSDMWDVRRLLEIMCRATMEIAQEAVARYDIDRNFMPRYDMTKEEQTKYGDRHSMFLSLLEDGFARLVPQHMQRQYRERLDKEIYVLESTDNVDYMLVQYDTAAWARANGILVGCGRGSAGGSLALYLLGITLIDPIKYDLIFERFLLPERAGLYPARTTLVTKEVESTRYVELTMESGRCLRIDSDARLLVLRDGQECEVYADDLRGGDDIVFDHRDYLWRVNYFDNERDDKTI